jgi:hypothetical protein
MAYRGEAFVPETAASTAESFTLEVGGQPFPVKSVHGGAAVGVVVNSPAGMSPFREKHLSGLQYEPIEIALGSVDNAAPLVEWVKAAWQGTRPQKNGAMMRAGSNGRPVSRREFVRAVVASTTIPKLDGSSNAPAFITVNLAPELARDVTPPTTLPPLASGSFSLNSSNFRLSIDGLDCNRVAKIESFTIQQSPGGIDFPNIHIELGAASAESWRTWFRSFVIGGDSSAGNEKSGTLSFLAPNLASVLATISLQNLGIFRLEDAPAETSGEIARVVADLYCERMALTVGPASVAPPDYTTE